MAHRENIGLIAITDHDTTEGVDEGREEAKRLGIGFIPGIEISSRCDEGVLHILGYHVETKHEGLQRGLVEFQTARRQRNHRIIKKLQDLGIAISQKELRSSFTCNTVSPGRPHIASALVSKGIVADIGEAFRQYLGSSGKAFVEKEIYSSKETINMIHRAGGKAYVAHPNSLNRQEKRLESYIARLCAEGLDGIEVYSAAHSAGQIKEYKRLASRLCLGISAGSDFHGTTKPYIRIGINHCGKRATSDLISLL